ncbi:hypothetical protein [Atopococcus tabaci]|uniref:hypothetical protein n=1 Tax=Atopococcus tabaci TaxID=269774 RepID=UPI0012EBFB1C|nr:hypothetical protein [Atopococcus tabaci]
MKREQRIKVALFLSSLLTGFYIVAKLDFRSTMAIEDAAVQSEEYKEIIGERNV